MDVELYVYDLTRGMARQLSQQFLGVQIDAVYHTSLVMDGIEYFFGAGVQTSYAGATHHGQPMEKIHMGTTHLPMEVILEYLESLKQIYTAESYDLFARNCNNFTNDFATFLVGRGIPEHITSLPKRVLDTPFGNMLKAQIDSSMRAITQAPVPPANKPPMPFAASSATQQINGARNPESEPYGTVVNVTSLHALEKKLKSASATAATVFFTSSTCAPCKLAYPTFDGLAESHPEALFVKVDINVAHDVAAHYDVRVTPTFMTFCRGTQLDQWTGADPRLLQANVNLLITKTFPPHPHAQLNVPTLRSGSVRPVIYGKVPPLEKLMAKLGTAAESRELLALRSFVAARERDPKEATLPDLNVIGETVTDKVLSLPPEVRFAAVDLLRCAMVDPRVSGFFAEQSSPSCVQTLLDHMVSLSDCPHNLRLVTIHLGCNLFSSPLYVSQILCPDSTAIASALIQLVSSSLLDASHPTARVAASWLAFNLASSNYRMRREQSMEGLAEGLQVELAASIVESLPKEDNEEAVKAQLTTLGYLLYFAPVNGELMDLCKALDAKAVVEQLKWQNTLRKEVAKLLE